MEIYRCNRNCGCMRCRYRGITWGVVFITWGVLWLLDTFELRGFDIHHTWSLILIVIGVVLMLQRTASADGHIQPYVQMSGQPYATPTAQPAPDAQTSTPSNEVRHE